MLRFLLTPRWLAVHLALILAVTFCVVAGWWQFGAYQDSQARHDERAQEPVPASELVQAGEQIGAAADRAVVAEGRYLTELRRFVPGRIHDGVLGWFVLVPIETRDQTIIPVLRGWVEEPELSDESLPSSVTVTGHLLPPETAEHATVRSGQTLDDDELAYIAPDTFTASTGLASETTIQGYLLLSHEEPSATDVALLDVEDVAPIRHVNPWQNLSYWAQWWLFALAAFVFWASAVRSGARSRRAATEGRSRDDDDGTGTHPRRVSGPAPPHVPS